MKKSKSNPKTAKGNTTAKTTNSVKDAPKTKAAAKPKAPANAKQSKKADKPKRTSALDAAAQVLAKAGQPMRTQELITAMAEQGLWKSPGGKTPHATLYAAMLREITEKGKDARFTKVDRGQFAFNNSRKG